MADAEDDLAPDRKLAEVLERWPQLEGVLRDLSPAFAAFENPLLRRTFAKAATLRQVARSAGLPLGVLLGALRRGAGLPPAPTGEEGAGEESPAPAWARAELVRASRDARADVAAGVHPLPLVLEDLERLGDGEVYALVTPMVPSPLLDLVSRRGYEAHVADPTEGAATTYLRRRPA